MNERAVSALASLQKCSAEEKDVILSELLHDKWRREGGEPTFVIRQNGRPDAGFCLVLNPAVPSTMPPLTASDWAGVEKDMKHLEDALTTEEAKDFLRQAVARRFSKE
jgi:hypothetical protein